MAGKTNSELILQAITSIAVLEDRLDRARDDVVRLETILTKTSEALNSLATRVTVSEEKFVDQKKALEENDRKRWMLSLAVAGTFLAFVANLAVSLLRK